MFLNSAVVVYSFLFKTTLAFESAPWAPIRALLAMQG
jgi:hypothetical protein